MLSGKRVALIGCGDIGGRLAKLLLARGAEVHGFRRNAAALPDYVHAHSVDVQDIASLRVLTDIAFDFVVITLTPDRFSEETYRQTYVQGLANILACLNRSRLQRLLWASSTSVYAQNDDSWVDESSITAPSSFSGRMQLQAEALLADVPQATVVRFSGIYRDSQYRLLERIKRGEISQTIQPDPYSNRIHVDDCAGALAHLIGRSAQALPVEALYLASDCLPVRYSDLLYWLAEQSGFTLEKEGVSEVGKAGSKRCNNQRLLDSGYQFIYADYKQGLQAQVLACKP